MDCGLPLLDLSPKARQLPANPPSGLQFRSLQRRASPTVSDTSPGLDLEKLFPFQLDDFQKQAIAALNNNHSVVVCAPTGSGKTLIGEYAIHRALANGKRVFYTTPLKALSNQKLRDFRAKFGHDTVGLLTGDLSINRDAPIVVMTAEIYRNMLYGTPISQVGTSVQDVEAVVLDECHYMNDRDRGTVWEEAIIYSPPSIQLVALSATVANSDQLTDWINEVHGPTELVYSDFRPVPLQLSFCGAKGLFPLLNDAGTGLHPNFKANRKTGKHKSRFDKGRNSRSGRKGRGRPERPDAPPITFVVSQLAQRDMLPAIYFIFSRRGCDKAMTQVAQLSLVTPEEAEVLDYRVKVFTAQNPDVARPAQVEALRNGIASHHAGLLPVWKGFVEELFQLGLIKVVFATETLAAGINMPARTTVLSSLSKRTDGGHRPLFASEFLQMAGRAGRRGMDEQGYVVTVQTRFEGAKEAARIATSGADPLVSQFTPSYGMVLNLLQTHSLEEARELVERSFGQYLARLTLRPQMDEIERVEQGVKQLKAQLEDVDWPLVQQYEKLKQRLKEENRLVRILQQQAQEVQQKELGQDASYAIAGTVLSLKGKNIPVREPVLAVLVSKAPGPGKAPFLICLSETNRWYVATTNDVVALHSEVPRIAEIDDLEPHHGLAAKAGSSAKGNEATVAIRDRLRDLADSSNANSPDLSRSPAADSPEVVTQQSQADEIQAQLEAHPVHQWTNQVSLMKRQRQLEGLERELKDRTSKFQRYAHRHWDEFMALIDILRAFDALDDLTPTPLGEAVAALRGDNELWMGLALCSGELDDLEPQQFAGACEAISTEVSRPDLWSDYPMSHKTEEALEGLRQIRRRLFQQQHRRGVSLPVWLELELVGMVENWALEVTWAELCHNTSLDEGDIVRVLRRTQDVLSQIPHVPGVSDAVRQNARHASYLVNRFPIRESMSGLEANEQAADD